MDPLSGGDFVSVGSAFSTAFKRAMGCSPRQYARRRMASAEAG